MSDTGCGMPEAIAGRAFDPFVTTKAMGRGTGLGLAVCHGIVRSMDGEISFEKRAPRGTTFHVALPASAANGEEAPVEPPARPAGRLRLLLVDDEPAICRSLEILWRDEHDVVSSTRATEALAKVAAGESFDVILCDLMMAEMNGMQLYEALRERNPRLARRVLFLTGGAFTPASQEFLEQVPNLRVDKPFDLKVLDEAMRTTRSLADAAEAAGA